MNDPEEELEEGAAESEEEDSGRTDKDFNSNLLFTARLFPALTAVLEGSYLETRNEEITRTTGGRVTITWRPSDILSVDAHWRKEWENSEGLPDLYSVTVGIAPTHKVQLNLGYNRLETKETYDISSTWHLNDIFTIFAGARYKDPSYGDSLTYKTMLTVRY